MPKSFCERLSVILMYIKANLTKCNTCLRALVPRLPDMLTWPTILICVQVDYSYPILTLQLPESSCDEASSGTYYIHIYIKAYLTYHNSYLTSFASRPLVYQWSWYTLRITSLNISITWELLQWGFQWCWCTSTWLELRLKCRRLSRFERAETPPSRHRNLKIKGKKITSELANFYDCFLKY